MSYLPDEKLDEIRVMVQKLNDEIKSPFDERVQDILELIVDYLAERSD